MLPLLMLISLQAAAPDADPDAASRMLDAAANRLHAVVDAIAAEDRSLRARSRWYYISADGTKEKPWPIYADQMTRHTQSDGVAMWTDMILTYSTAKQTYSWKTQSVYDCAGRRSRLLAGVVSLFDGTVTRVDNSEGSWSPIIPNTIGENAFRFACGTLAGQPIGATTPEKDAPSRADQIAQTR